MCGPATRSSARAVRLRFVARHAFGHAMVAAAAMRLDVYRGLRSTYITLEALRLALARPALSHADVLFRHKDLFGQEPDADRDGVADDVEHGRRSLDVLAELLELHARRVGLDRRRERDALEAWPHVVG